MSQMSEEHKQTIIELDKSEVSLRQNKAIEEYNKISNVFLAT